MSEYLSTAALTTEADRTYAYALGSDRPHVAWILSDRDVWYANPSYIGPKAEHPEAWEGMDDDCAAMLAEEARKLQAQVTRTHGLRHATRDALGTVEFGVMADGRVLVNGTAYEVATARRLYRALVSQEWIAF